MKLLCERTCIKLRLLVKLDFLSTTVRFIYFVAICFPLFSSVFHYHKNIRSIFHFCQIEFSFIKNVSFLFSSFLFRISLQIRQHKIQVISQQQRLIINVRRLLLHQFPKAAEVGEVVQIYMKRPRRYWGSPVHRLMTANVQNVR